jgi:hypothetical protein
MAIAGFIPYLPARSREPRAPYLIVPCNTGSVSTPYFLHNSIVAAGPQSANRKTPGKACHTLAEIGENL